jgi:hypothetical protein
MITVAAPGFGLSRPLLARHVVAARPFGDLAARSLVAGPSGAA